jgi:hypothetical protein
MRSPGTFGQMTCAFKPISRLMLEVLLGRSPRTRLPSIRLPSIRLPCACLVG